MQNPDLRNFQRPTPMEAADTRRRFELAVIRALEVGRWDLKRPRLRPAIPSKPGHGVNHALNYTRTHLRAALLLRMASQSLTSSCPSAAFAKRAGVFFPLAMCSYTQR